MKHRVPGHQVPSEDRKVRPLGHKDPPHQLENFIVIALAKVQVCELDDAEHRRLDVHLESRVGSGLIPAQKQVTSVIRRTPATRIDQSV